MVLNLIGNAPCLTSVAMFHMTAVGFALHCQLEKPDYCFLCGYVVQISMVTDHSSMATQWEQELTLQDCLRSFSQRCVNDIIIVMVTS